MVLLCLVFSVLCFKGNCDGSEFSVKFLKAPHAFSHLNSAKFVFEVLEAGNDTCSYCDIICKVGFLVTLLATFASLQTTVLGYSLSVKLLNFF